MPDMKTALSTALQTWTQGDKEPDVQAPAPEPKRHGFPITNNVSRALFDYVKAHPGTPRTVVRRTMAAAGFSETSVSSLIGQFLTVGHFRVVGGCLFTNVENYTPIKASELRAIRASKPPRFQYPRPRRKDAPVVDELHKTRKDAIDELRETLQRKEKEDLAFNPQALVDKLTLPQARQLYDLLRRYLSV